jgi:predicted permease
VITRLRAVWKNLFHRNQLESDLDEELRAYVELVSSEKMRSGMPAEQAYRAALREVGGVDQVKQSVRDIRVGALLGRVAQDIRYGIRTLAKNPVFSLIAIATLALGIGANTAMFSLLDQVVLRLLPVKQPEQLMIVAVRGNNYGNSFGDNDVSYPMYEDLRDRNRVFSGMFCRFPTSVTLGVGNHAARIQAELVSGSYFPVLGVDAALGRTITPSDDRVPDGHPVAMLSYSFWRSYFHADRSILGRAISLNGYAMTVIGVARPGFDGVELGNPAKVFVPIMMKTEMTPYWDGIKDRRRRLKWVTAYGRLKPGVNAQQAQEWLQSLLHGILEMEVQEPDFRKYSSRDREDFLRNRIELVPGSDSHLRDQMRKPLWVLIALTAAVLLLACANVANLLLARATARKREMAVRLAIGAGRARIARQLLVESLLLSGAGALLGLGLAFVADRLLLNMYLPAGEAADFAVTAVPDLRVLGFGLCVMLLTGVAFGMLPAIQSAHTEIAPTLKDTGGAVIRGSILARKLLVCTQVGLSLLLLVGAGLFVRTLRNLRNQGPGFPADHLLSFSVDPSLSGYSDERTRLFDEQLRTMLTSAPGIESVGLSSVPLLQGSAWKNAISAEGSEPKPIQDQPFLDQVSPGLFRTLGIPILAGRDFTLQDAGANGGGQAMINETFAREYFPGRNPIGLHIGLVDFESLTRSKPNTEVIGVVKDTKFRDLREPTTPQAYFSYLEGSHFRGISVYVRTRSDPRQMMDRIRELMRQFDPNVPIVDLQIMDDQLDASLRTERLVASLSAVFGGLATLLAVIGLYGVMAYAVARRTREMGIRMALGATRGNVVGLVMREVSILVIAGLVAGASLALASANLIRSQLFGLNPHDPWTLIGAAFSLAIAAGIAGFIPALRASSVDPTSALRQE